MKKRTVYSRLSACNLLLMAAASCWIFIQSGCNNSSAQSGKQTDQKTSTTWSKVDITFKRNTNAEWREKSIREIEKMLIDSVARFAAPYAKDKKYQNFYPAITITKMPFWDSLRYQISILNTYSDGKGGEPLQRDGRGLPPCPPRRTPTPATCRCGRWRPSRNRTSRVPPSARPARTAGSG